MADVLNLPVERFEDCEASGRGAAVVAAAALGRYPSIAAAGAAMVGETRLTAPNVRAVACYDNLYQTAYQPLYGRLKSLFAKQFSS
jgi:sugar (pentulose or hexulose) kinase